MFLEDHAITVALNTIAEAEIETKPLQIVAIDLESAFNTMEPLIAKEAMLALGYHEEYTNKYHEFTTGGKVNIQVNGISGGKFTPTKGLDREIQPAHRNSFGTLTLQQND